MVKWEWDDHKAASNLQKHAVSFDEAVSDFGDTLALTFSDTDHAERRNNIRIISARKATRYEKGIYENG